MEGVALVLFRESLTLPYPQWPVYWDSLSVAHSRAVICPLSWISHLVISSKLLPLKHPSSCFWGRPEDYRLPYLNGVTNSPPSHVRSLWIGLRVTCTFYSTLWTTSSSDLQAILIAAWWIEWVSWATTVGTARYPFDSNNSGVTETYHEITFLSSPDQSIFGSGGSLRDFGLGVMEPKLKILSIWSLQPDH